MIATKKVAYLAPNESEQLPTPAGFFSVKLDADQTDGAYAILVSTVPSQAGPPPLHSHPFGESFWVLRGTFEFSAVTANGLETLVLHDGGLLHVPSNVPHTFKNVGEETGELLVIASPVLVDFLREIAALGPFKGPEDMVRAAPVMRKYQVVPVNSTDERRVS